MGMVLTYSCVIRMCDTDVGRRTGTWQAALLQAVAGHMLQEEARLKRSNFAPLLKDAQMHRALLAISFEMVLHVHAPLVKPFAQVLRSLEVSEFEVLVMIENIHNLFELSRTQMSDGVRRHLKNLQNKMVECEAWKKDSVLLQYLEEPVLASLFNKEQTCVDVMRASPLHRSPAQSPVRPSANAPPRVCMPPPESPLRVGARLPPRHPG
eukprot:CAMPEP_0173088548 /NCGR_PEP_ID=MMETSP1102-20130122/25046_1 /TAXON_ID=49646 /ORGANISM="Geminigera sp., Strain Caron Lab Isolate" /LENGTH=208 /DNA_ID=CAMNT_0013971565 /DNA_START=56 /DNA_END=679 /DNA_ORIENTATION=-